MNLKNINKNIEIREIETKLWHAVEILRKEQVLSAEYYLILFLLILQRGNSKNFEVDKEFVNEEDFLEYVKSVNKLKDGYDLMTVYLTFESTILKVAGYPLRKLINLIKSLNPQVLDNYFSEIFDNFLFKISKSEGRTGGESIQPLELTKFISEIMNLQQFKSVYNPFAGFASFGIHLNEDQYYLGQELNRLTCSIANLRLLAYDRNSKKAIISQDSVNNWEKLIINRDLIIAHPPFMLRMPKEIEGRFGKIRTVEDFIITNSIDNISDKGRLITLVPTHFLHKSSKSDLKLKSHLINNDLLEMVISFPGGLLSNTGASFAIIVINKSKQLKNKVRMIDATYFMKHSDSKLKKLNYEKLTHELSSFNESDTTKFVSNDRIAEEAFNLNIHRYFLIQINGVKLSDFSQFVKPVNPSKEIIAQSNVKDEGKLFVRIRDLKDDNFDFYLDEANIKRSKARKTTREVAESCLLLAVRWKTLKPTYFEFKGEPIYVSHDIVPIKIDESKVNITYLINELHADYIEDQLKAYRITKVVPLIKKKDLLNLKIKLPDSYSQTKHVESLKEQQAKVAGISELSEKIKRLQEERNALAHGQTIKEFDEFASLKHSLGTPRQNILSHSEVLIKFFEKMDSEEFDKVNQKFLDFFGKDLISVSKVIKNDVNYISELLEKGESGLILENHTLENIPIIKLQKLIKDIQVRDLNFSLRVQPISSSRKNQLGVLCNKTLFKVMIENIFNNASKHGFKDDNSNKEVIIDLSVVENNSNEDKFVIDIKNNGSPFPENYNKSVFTTKYSTADTENGTGLGGYDIDRIATYFKNPDWELILNDDPLYPVKFRFEFPIIFNE